MNKKIWALAVSKLNECDIAWLKGLRVGVKVETLNNKIYFSGRVVRTMVTGHQIEIETTCEKQENMLYLKYGEDLILKEIIEDTYGIKHSN